MKLAPKDIYEQLEFDKVLELPQQYCYGELGQAYFQQLQPTTDIGLINQWLDEVAEFLETYENKHNFPLSQYETIAEPLRMLEIENYVLSVDSLRQVANTLLLCYEVYSFFKKRKSAKSLYPTLYNIIRDVDFDKELLDEINRVVDEEGNIRSNASPELMRIARMQSSKRQELDKKFRKISVHYQSKGWLKENIESFRNGRRVLAVPAEHKRKVRGIIHDESATGKTVFIEPEGVIDLNNDLFDLEQDYKREIYRILRALSDLLRPYISYLQHYEDVLVRFDTIQAKGQLANLLDANRPVVKAVPFFNIKTVYHPLLLLKNKEEGEKTVPFDLHFRNKNRILMLSGPNAGGKSICMKAIGLVQLMMQVGMLVPIEEGGEMGVVEQVFADIGDQQSIEDDLSTYSSRLTNARYFLEHANDKTLVLIDEFGSGTDPKMGGAIAESILRDLNRKQVFGVITTHYSNLKIFAFEHKGIVNGAMIFDKDTLRPTYKMRIGKPGSSYAFEIAMQTGLPQPIIKYARKKAGKKNFDLEDLLVDLQKERQKTLEQQVKLLEERKEIDRLIKNYEHAYRELEFKRKKLKLEQKEQEKVSNENLHKEAQKLLRQIKEEKNKEKAAKKAKKLLNKTQKERKKINQKVDGLKKGIYKSYEKLDDGQIEVGSQVRLRSGGGTGTVREINKKEAKVEMGNFSLTIKLRDLQLIKNPIKLTKSTKVQTDTLKQQAHFEPLLDIRGMRQQEAMESVQRFMDNALMANATEVKIIHGKGSGVLRQVVNKKLREYPNIDSYFHPEPQAGGDGVTIVELG